MCCFVRLLVIPVVTDLLGDHGVHRFQEFVVRSSNIDVSEQLRSGPTC